MELQFLVGIVDAELLEGVQLKHLETEDVQDADGVGRLGGGLEGGVHLNNNSIIQVSISIDMLI